VRARLRKKGKGLSSLLPNFFRLLIAFAVITVLGNVIMPEMATFNSELLQTAIPQAHQQLKQVYRHEQEQIHRPTNFTVPAIIGIALGRISASFSQRVRAKVLNPFDSRNVVADVSPVVQRNLLSHCNDLLHLMSYYTTGRGVLSTPQMKLSSVVRLT